VLEKGLPLYFVVVAAVGKVLGAVSRTEDDDAVENRPPVVCNMSRTSLPPARFAAVLAVLISTSLRGVRSYDVYEDGATGLPLPG